MPGLLNTREAGRAQFFCADTGKLLAEFSMVACAHCGGQFAAPKFGTSEADKRTRIGRGYCQRCDGYICGKSCSGACVPLEQYLQNIEAGRPDADTYCPIIVPTSFYGASNAAAPTKPGE